MLVEACPVEMDLVMVEAVPVVPVRVTVGTSDNVDKLIDKVETYIHKEAAPVNTVKVTPTMVATLSIVLVPMDAHGAVAFLVKARSISVHIGAVEATLIVGRTRFLVVSIPVKVIQIVRLASDPVVSISIEVIPVIAGIVELRSVLVVSRRVESRFRIINERDYKARNIRAKELPPQPTK